MGGGGELRVRCVSAAACSALVGASGGTIVRSGELGWKVWALRRCSGAQWAPCLRFCEYRYMKLRNNKALFVLVTFHMDRNVCIVVYDIFGLVCSCKTISYNTVKNKR